MDERQNAPQSPVFPPQNPARAVAIPAQSPEFRTQDPTRTVAIPATSRERPLSTVTEELSGKERFKNYIYNKKDKTYCERTCTNWMQIIAYAIMYMIFLSTYFLIFLYPSLLIIRHLEVYKDSALIDRSEMISFSDNGIGLSATPISDGGYPMISYRKSQSVDYEQYLHSIDNLLGKKRRKRDLSLGPCAQRPYGYGDQPCVIIRINKLLDWKGKPLEANSTEASMAPAEVRAWLKQDKKLWLHCDGANSYDKEHIGKIQYHPNPPGYDPSAFPIKKGTRSPLVAVQLSNFTLGVSLNVECRLWYVTGPSMVDFMLYVAPDDRPSNI